jgi:hypothetical protein
MARIPGTTKAAAHGLTRRADLPALGWREWIALPDLEVPRVKVKVDTGARSSALHAYNIRLYDRGERTYVRFDIHPLQRDCTRTIPAQAEVVGVRNVRSSTGQVELRPVIATRISVGEHSWPIELTLTNRDQMGFRMLLGRQAIRGRFVVDGGRSYLQSRKRRREAR